MQLLFDEKDYPTIFDLFSMFSMFSISFRSGVSRMPNKLRAKTKSSRYVALMAYSYILSRDFFVIVCV